MMNFRMGSFEVHTSLITSHHFQWVIVKTLRVIHWGGKLVRRLPSTTTTSMSLGVVYNPFQKARRDLHRQALPSSKGLLSTSWLRKQLKYRSCHRLSNQARGVVEHHGSHTVMSTHWHSCE